MFSKQSVRNLVFTAALSASCATSTPRRSIGDVLLEASHSRDPQTRAIRAHELGEQRTERSRLRLVEMLSDPEREVRFEAALSLATNYRDQTTASRVLIADAPNLSTLSDIGFYHVIDAISRTSGDSAFDMLLSLLRSLPDDSQQTSQITGSHSRRNTVLTALVGCRSQNRLHQIENLLSGDNSDQLLGLEIAERTFLYDRNSHEVRALTPLLLNCYLHGSDAVRSASINLVIQTMTSEHMSAIIDASATRDSAFKSDTIRVLSAFTSSESAYRSIVLRELFSFAINSSDTALGHQAARVFAETQISPDENREGNYEAQLVRLFGSSNDQLRRNAAIAFRGLSHSTLNPIVDRLVGPNRDPNPRVREVFVYILHSSAGVGEHAEQTRIQTLRTVANSDPNSHVRQIAAAPSEIYRALGFGDTDN